MCGTAQWEWAENKYAYEAVSQFCQGCYIKHVTDDDNALPGTTVTLLPTSGQSAAKRRVKEQRLAERMSANNGGSTTNS